MPQCKVAVVFFSVQSKLSTMSVQHEAEENHQCSHHINPCAVTESRELFGIEELVHFEPYRESLLKLLFDQEDGKKTVTVTDDFFT